MYAMLVLLIILCSITRVTVKKNIILHRVKSTTDITCTLSHDMYNRPRFVVTCNCENVSSYMGLNPRLKHRVLCLNINV